MPKSLKVKDAQIYGKVRNSIWKSNSSEILCLNCMPANLIKTHFNLNRLLCSGHNVKYGLYRHSAHGDSELSTLAEFRTHQRLYACPDYMKV